MAGEWIAMRHDLWECPEVVSILSAICQQSVSTTADTCQHSVSKTSARVRIMGALYRTWCLIDRFAVDGILHGYTAEMLDDEVDWVGWSENLQHVGWLVIEPQSLVVPGFEEHFSQSSKRRLSNARYQAASRKKRQQSVSTTADKVLTTEQKRTEQNKKKNPLPPIPEKLDAPEFAEAWSDWMAYRREIKKPLTSHSLKAQLAKLSDWGVPRSVAAIRHTIAMGWQGLREPEPVFGKPGQNGHDTEELRRRILSGEAG